MLWIGGRIMEDVLVRKYPTLNLHGANVNAVSGQRAKPSVWATAGSASFLVPPGSPDQQYERYSSHYSKKK